MFGICRFIHKSQMLFHWPLIETFLLSIRHISAMWNFSNRAYVIFEWKVRKLFNMVVCVELFFLMKNRYLFYCSSSAAMQIARATLPPTIWLWSLTQHTNMCMFIRLCLSFLLFLLCTLQFIFKCFLCSEWILFWNRLKFKRQMNMTLSYKHNHISPMKFIEMHISWLYICVIKIAHSYIKCMKWSWLKILRKARA